MAKALTNRLDKIEPLILAQAGQLEKSVYGIVGEVIDGKPVILRKWKGTIGKMELTDEDPTILIAEVLEPVILKHKKYKCLFGGRAGTKSMSSMDIMAGEVNSCGSGVFCLREQMKSLSQSIYKGINSRIKDLNLAGFTPVESRWKIDHKNGGIISFGGMRNVEDMKSLFRYKFFLLEEAANTSQETLDILGPTLRGVEGAELWFLWNPKSCNDPMSKEFIIPYQAELDKHGYYEDDYHLIINVNYRHNPWFMGDSSLRTEIEKDQQKVADGRMSKARYNHIWEGAFNDDVENSLIDADWFDACVDAHLKLGFQAVGGKVVTHDPSDTGDDAKGYALRHGVVFTDVRELKSENANLAFDEACGLAIQAGANTFGWDCDGMGALLRNQAEVNFKGTPIKSFMYKGSESPYLPDSIFEPSDNIELRDQKKNSDVFRNRRAQNYVNLSKRIYKTYEAVVLGKYHNPDDLISFSSEIKDLQKLRAELCRLPVKPVSASGRIELYTKAEMKAGIMLSGGQRVSIPSPNLADCVKMSFDLSAVTMYATAPQIRAPKPRGSIGRR